MAEVITNDGWDLKVFRGNLVKQVGNGRKLLEELDKFTSLARQLLISRQNAGRKTNEFVETDKMDGQLSGGEDEQDSGADEQESSDEQGLDEASQRRRKALALGAQKNLPVTVEDERIKEKTEQRLEKAKRRVRGSRLVQELCGQLEERPEQVRDRPFFASDVSKQEKARLRYEETHFRRLGRSKEEQKAERKRRQQTGNQLDQLLSFGRYRMPENGTDQSVSGAKRMKTSNKWARNKSFDAGDGDSSPQKKKQKRFNQKSAGGSSMANHRRRTK